MRRPGPERHDRWFSLLGRGTPLLVGTVALLLAFAGSAAAGSLITGRQIKDGTIASVDLRDGSLKGADVRDGGLTRSDFGPLPQGAQGLPGSDGSPGPDGAQNVSRPVETRNLLEGQTDDWAVSCASGTHLIGGGVTSTLPAVLFIQRSGPEGNQWHVEVTNQTGLGTATVTASAVCAR